MTSLRHLLLDGITVVERGAGAAVSYAGRLLSDAGAEVTKVRAAGSPSSAWSSVLDFAKAVVEDAPPPARILLLGDGVPAAEIPTAGESIIVRVTPWGSGAAGRADDLSLQAAAGICAGIGLPGKPPLKLPLDQSAFQGGVVAAIAACAALLAGKGATIDIAIAEVWASFYSGLEVANARFGRSRTARAGHRTLGVPWPRTIMRCKDGYFAIQCATRDHWRRFLAMVGRPELETAPLFADRLKTNDRHGDEAEALFADWFGARSKAELTSEFLKARLPGAPVLEPRELATEPQLQSRGAIREIALPGGGSVLALNPPYRIVEGGGAREAAAQAGDARKPLAGVRVVDFGWVWAGAVPGHILADLGAEVIKVETGQRLDYMRQGRPIFGTARDPEQNPMFQCVNRGKLSFKIDMTKPAGAALLRQLIAASDVVVENFTPGVLARCGLDWQSVSALRPGLVMCSMSAVGSDGPLREIRTYATMIAGLAGLDSMVGYPGGRVLGSQSSYADPNASLHAAFAILAALVRRRRTGAGCWIDLSQWEAGAALVGEAIADGAKPSARPLLSGVYPALGEDRWIAITIEDDTGWRTLADELGAPAWMQETPPAPGEGGAATDARLGKETARFDAEELALRLSHRGVAAAAVAVPGRLLEDPRFAAAGLFEEVDHPALGKVPVYRLPWRIDGERLPLSRRAPLLGEHNDYILDEILHLAPAQRQALEADGVFT